MQLEVSKHQKFVMENVARSTIQLHPQNPRIISEGARKKLKGKMAEVGLLQPLIVNRTTGYLLGGHQRLASLDSLERYKDGNNDYRLDVAVVELDARAELEMLVFLNNPSGQGSWNLDELANIAIEGVTFDGMGFDKVDIEMMFDGDSRFEELFTDTQEVAEAKNALQDIKQAGRDAKSELRSEARIGVAGTEGTGGNNTDGSKSGLDSFREKGAKNISSDFYVVVVCQDQEQKEALMKHLRVPKGEKYISPSEIMSLKR